MLGQSLPQTTHLIILVVIKNKKISNLNSSTDPKIHMKFYLVMILAILFLPFASNSNAETVSPEEQLSDAKDTALLDSLEISDPRVKILDFEGRATSAIVNEKTNTVYVTDFNAAKLHIIDGHSDELIESIDVIKTPFGVGINPETNMIYVGGEYANILSVINADTKQVVSEIPLKDPYDIAVNPTNNMIYVTSDRSNSVYVIDGKTNELVTSFEVLVPCGIAVNPATGMVYVTSESEDIVHVFDGNTNEIVTTINVEDSPRGVTVNPITNTIYVTNQESNTVSVIDGSSNKIIDSIPTGETPRRVVVNPQTNTVYVTNQGSKNISVIDGKNNKIIETIPVAEPFELAINSKTNKLYSMWYAVGKLSVISDNPRLLQFSDSPLKQTSKGVEPNLVVCNMNFELILKASDNSPACVKPATAEKLIQRGWARE